MNIEMPSEWWAIMLLTICLASPILIALVVQSKHFWMFFFANLLVIVVPNGVFLLVSIIVLDVLAFVDRRRVLA